MEKQIIECPLCHTPNPSDSAFCNKCGTQFGLESGESGAFTKTMVTPRLEFAKGDTLAKRYDIIEELGKGGMGFVYKVFDTKIQEEVALKVLKPEVAAHKETITRFSNELKYARRITHKNVCRMHDINEAQETHFITMEYVEGETLKSVINRTGKLKLGNVLSVALQVTDGLAEAHSLGIVHRDLKPQNIMIDKQGNAKVMDFGIARSVEGKGMTVDGMVIGTPEYMSPEQVEGKKADNRSDIYSMGAVLYEMVTGKVPFSGDTAFSVALKQKSEKPKDPQKLNPGLPKDMVRLILKCMEKERNKRFQSAEELMAALMSVEETLPEKERVVPKIMPRFPAAGVKKLTLKKLLIPAAAFLVVVAAGIFAWRQLTPQQPVITDTGRPTIAILPVKNSTGDAALDIWKENLQEWLIQDMMQSKYFHVLDFSRVYSVLTKTDLWEAQNYTERNLKDVAEEAKATHIIQSSLIKTGENFRILSTLKDARTMNTIAAENVNGKGVDSFTDMVDSLTRQFKPHFDLTEEQIANDFDMAVGEVTTNNERALQLYIEGKKYADAADPLQAGRSFEQAVAVDPDFAIAHWRLSRAYLSMVTHGMADGQDMKPKYDEATQKAYELSQQGKVSKRERLLIEAFCGPEGLPMGNPQFLEKLVELYPEDMLANERLASFYHNWEEYDQAMKPLELLIRKNTASSYTYLQLAQIYFHRGDNQKAKEITEQGLEKFPDSYTLNCFLPSPYAAEGRLEEALLKWENFFLTNPTLYKKCLRKGSILLLQEDFKGAEEEYRKMLSGELEQSVWTGYVNLIDLYLLQGRFNDAFAQIDLAKKKWGENDSYINRELFLVHVSRGDWDKALELAGFSYTNTAVSIYAKLNLWEKVEKAIEKQKDGMQAHAKRIGFVNKIARRNYLRNLGIVELEKGNLDLAIEYFTQAIELFTGIHHQNFSPFVEDLAQAYYRAGNLERAAEEFGLITTLTWGRIDHGDIYAKSFYMLGKIYEEMGKKKDAKSNYERFLDLWQNADPGLPEVDDAKTRLDAL